MRAEARRPPRGQPHGPSRCAAGRAAAPECSPRGSCVRPGRTRLRQDREQRRDVAVTVAERRRLREPLVGERGRGKRNVLASSRSRARAGCPCARARRRTRPHRGGRGRAERGRAGRRADRASGHDVDRQLARDPAALGEQNALAESEHLRGKADVDRELEQQALAVRSDVPDGGAELVQQRLDRGEGARRRRRP